MKLKQNKREKVIGGEVREGLGGGGGGGAG